MVVSEGFVGEEAVLGLPRYLTTVSASEESMLLRVPAHAVPAAVRRFRDPRVWPIVQHLLRSEAPVADVVPAESWGAPVGLRRLAAWVLVVLVPASIFYFGADSELFSPDNGQRWRQLRTATVLSCGCLLWALGITRPYVAGLLMLFCLLALGVVSSVHTLSGFASSTFFMALSLLVLGALVVRSGLVTRVAVRLEELFPTSGLARHLATMGCICGATAVMPNDRSRASTWLEVQASLFPTESHEHDRSLVIRTMMASYVSLFAPLYLTGSTANLILVGAMPKQRQAGLDWLQWFQYGGVAFLTVLVGVVAFMLWNRESFEEPAELRRQRVRGRRIRRRIRRRIIGRLGPLESIVICAVLVWGIAQLTTDFHQIDHRLIALLMLATFLIGTIASRNQINESIDWHSLLLLGAVIGLTSTVFEVELANVFVRAFPRLSGWFMDEPVVFIVAVALLGTTIDAVAPHGSVLVGFLTLPIAVAHAFDPWVLIFVVLMTAHHPVATRDAGGSDRERRFVRRWQVQVLLLRLVAVFVSIPYWRALEVI